MNILIPMAGAGSRFEKAGYTFPKPLIEINGKPMIQAVVENLNIDANYIYIVQKSHRDKYNLDTLLNFITPKCSILDVENITEGAACTALLAKNLINNNEPLIITNCDQITEDLNINNIIKFAKINGSDGILGVFKSISTKNSYVKINENFEIIEVKEKIVISNDATTGFHFWKHGSMFVESAIDMIKNNESYNNEFYVAPTFNYLIKNNKKIHPYYFNLHFPVGTPEDIYKFINTGIKGPNGNT